MPVDFCGSPCDMDRLMALARKNKFRVVEDAAHAFGSDYKGAKVGTRGDAVCFSFDPIKNITTGEGERSFWPTMPSRKRFAGCVFWESTKTLGIATRTHDVFL